jgi:tripartite-type tricarboxylate transporter receptor subunit TctC
MFRQFLALAATALILGLTGAFNQAAAGYPERPVRLIVPFPPGGTTDVVARIAADKLGTTLGQSFIVDNRPGASSIIGSDLAAKSAPDGYTILVGSIANSIIPALYKKVPYDLDGDLVPLCRVISLPNFLVVGASSPYKTVKDLIAAAKANPGKLTFASTGIGASPHLSGELFKLMTGTDIVHIPYKGSGPAQLDLMSGRVDMMFDNAAISQVKGGKLRALAVSSGARAAAAPDLPTVSESGVPGFAISSWYGLWAPKGTPEPIVTLLRLSIEEAFKDPAVQEKLRGLGAQTDIACGPAFASFIDLETAKWGAVVKQTGIKLDF